MSSSGTLFETGQLFCSSKRWSEWRLLANFLPPALSVETALVRGCRELLHARIARYQGFLSNVCPDF